MPSELTVRKEKPLKLDCTALLDHLNRIQGSIPWLYQYHLQQQQLNNLKPNLQMMNFSKGHLTRTSNSHQWYILVASTPYAVSAQLIPVPKSPDTIVTPDLIQCTPISVWTCAEACDGDIQQYIVMNDNADSSNEQPPPRKNNKLEILSCHPTILIQESSPSTTHKSRSSKRKKIESLIISIVIGTTHSRVLSIQLSISSYVGISGEDEGRYVLSKVADSSNNGDGIIEPLPLDTDEIIRKHLGENNNNNSSHNDGQSINSGSKDTNTKESSQKSSTHNWVPFRPSGGVSTLSQLYTSWNNYNHSIQSSKIQHGDDFLWITYGDGTLVRLPRWAFFPINDECFGDVDNELDNTRTQIGVGLKNQLVKAMIMINPKKKNVGLTNKTTIVPLPQFFPSLMSQPLQSLATSPLMLEKDWTDVNDSDDESGQFSNGMSTIAPTSGESEFIEAVAFGQENTNHKNKSYVAPTFAFYTNDDQMFSESHAAITEEHEELTTVQNIIRGGSTIIGGTAAIAKGMLGGMMGVMLGKSKHTEEESMNGMIIGQDGNGSGTSISSAMVFPSVNEESTKLPLTLALFDSPRQIINASIDPVDGMLMACADNLGRVQLIDLSTKQVIRMWKGFREATCHWIQFPFKFETGQQIVKYLTIHCRERKLLEIYRMRHGPRIIQVPTASDAQVVQCTVASKGDASYTKCFVLQNNTKTKRCIAIELKIHDKELHEAVLEKMPKKSAEDQDEKYLANHQSLNEGTIQLQLLRQLIGSNLPSNLDTIYAALTQITAISDLSKAIDVLAVSSKLEDMGVDDSSFHCEVLTHAQKHLNIALSDEIIASSNNPILNDLQNKIDFHNQLVSSFDILHQFENTTYADDDNDDVAESKSPWVDEGLSWIQTAENVYGHSIDVNISIIDSNISFSMWSNGCLQDGSASYRRNEDGQPALYLCDSTRERKKILLHIFHPLTKDIFIFKTTHQIFEQMGIQKDHDKLLQYYGEWFMSLPKAILEKQCIGLWCPTVRWIHDIVQEFIDGILNETIEEHDFILLKSLHEFCADSSDLPRAFLLATICRDAIDAATKQLEERTYGKITCEVCVKPWEQLLRKIRVCLLVSLRLHGKPVGPLPITVSNVENGLYSVYQWIAMDLLSFSHDQLEVTAVELACRNSAISFFPSSEFGDNASNWKMVQESCMIQSSECPLDKSHPGPLLFFLNHYNNSLKLAAHRALLLCQQWGHEPESLDLLQNALDALQNIGRDEVSHSALLAAALLEIWETHIRPIYRALLFGFHEVHELCEEIITPLLSDPHRFGSFNRISMKIVMMLLSTIESEPYEEADDLSFSHDEDIFAWPDIKDDVIIKSLYDNAVELDESSLEAHHGIICAVQLNDELSLLPHCVDSFDSLFLRQSFGTKFPRSFTMNEDQQTFMETAIRRQAELCEGPTLNRDYLDDLVTLGRLWGLDKGRIVTQFLLMMYELGKDDFVEDFINSVTRLLDVDEFLDQGTAIVCVRLNTALSLLKKSKQCRSILAILDADTCEWVREQARSTCEENPDIVVTYEDGTLISLDSTHALILRMKRMSGSNRIDTYALFSMCETLLQAMDTMERR